MPSVATLAVVVGLALIGAWRWWLAPLVDGGPLVAADALRWRAPGECVEVYRIRVDERYRDASVATFLGKPEVHATAWLALAADPEGATIDALLISEDGEPPRARELRWSPSEIGPRAPDFACRRRGWDPVEDALALGWPKLPAAPTRVGDRWTGAAVEGRCHETVCLEPDGSFGHAVPCRARPWTEVLAGAEAGEIRIRGDWDDGHDPARPEIGILTSREVVLAEGRPLSVRAVIDQRWAGVKRELSLVRIDDCGDRSPATDDDLEQLADVRARFREQFHARLSPPAAD